MRRIKTFILSLMGIVIFTGCFAKNEERDSSGDENLISGQLVYPDEASQRQETGENRDVVGDDLPVSRALAAKMAVLALNDRYAAEGLEREIAYGDCDDNFWGDKYINAAVIQGLMAGEGNVFRPDDNLTILEAQNLLNAMNHENTIKMRITDDNRDMAISYALWVQLYESAVKELLGADLEATGHIEEKNLVILADSGNNAKLPEGNIIADSGPYTAYGLDMGAYLDKEVKVLEKDGEILAVLSMESNKPEMKGAYVVGLTDGKLTIFLGGAERTYEYGGQEKIAAGDVCGFTLQSGKAENLYAYGEGFIDTVKRHDTAFIELATAGEIPLSEDFRVYSEENGPVKWRKAKNIIVGSNTVRFFMDNGMISAAVIESTFEAESIRVAIKTTGMESFIHDTVEITGTGAFKVTAGGVEKQFSAGEQFTLSAGETLDGRVYVEPIDGRLVLESIGRGYGIPSYRGILEICKNETGYLIVNEVNLEEYLYSVVPSEMPVSYGQEALKVQAVTARSYAYNQFYANTFHQYGANVCDSVISQVYNNVNETEESIRAVDETKGLCLTYGGSVISANFFSTSAGVTANNGEVWADSLTKKFPAETSPYLASKSQYTGQDYGDLSIEENMAGFIKSKDINAYDSFSNWFRWYVEMTGDEIAASINANLKERYEAAPRLIKTLQPDGVFRSRPVESIGDLVNIEVVKRGDGGNIMTMKITGTANTIMVNTEYNIRTLIRPKQYVEGGESIELTLSDGKTRQDYSLMPSAFFAMERMTDGEGKIVYVKFYGGGNGHGAGMSQTGVKGMVDAGKTFEEILSHYYEGTMVEKKW